MNACFSAVVLMQLHEIQAQVLKDVLVKSLNFYIYAGETSIVPANGKASPIPEIESMHACIVFFSYARSRHDPLCFICLCRLV